MPILLTPPRNFQQEALTAYFIQQQRQRQVKARRRHEEGIRKEKRSKWWTAMALGGTRTADALYGEEAGGEAGSALRGAGQYALDYAGKMAAQQQQEQMLAQRGAQRAAEIAQRHENSLIEQGWSKGYSTLQQQEIEEGTTELNKLNTSLATKEITLGQYSEGLAPLVRRMNAIKPSLQPPKSPWPRGQRSGELWQEGKGPWAPWVTRDHNGNIKPVRDKGLTLDVHERRVDDILSGVKKPKDAISHSPEQQRGARIEAWGLAVLDDQVALDRVPMRFRQAVAGYVQAATPPTPEQVAQQQAAQAAQAAQAQEALASVPAEAERQAAIVEQAQAGDPSAILQVIASEQKSNNPDDWSADAIRRAAPAAETLAEQLLRMPTKPQAILEELKRLRKIIARAESLPEPEPEPQRQLKLPRRRGPELRELR
jgi:hypothetical protein